MKMLFAAIALTIASPALAQAPADAHAGHDAEAHQTGHAGHTTPSNDPHAGHEMGGGCCDKAKPDGKMMPCCEKMKAAGRKMDCCDKQAKAKASTADPHAGHDMSQH